MMQSILLTTPSKSPAGEKIGETKATDEARNVEGKAGEDKASLDFSSVLDEVSADDEVQSKGEEALDIEALLLDEEISPSDEETESTQQSIDSALLLEDALEEKGDSEHDNLQEDGEAINPIIAQIESAQKTDTKVNDSKSTVMVEESGIGSKDTNKDGAIKSSAKNTKLKFDSLLSDNISGKELSSKENLASSNKLEAITAALNPETAKPVVNQNTESNMLHSLGATNSNIDRPLQQATATSAQSLLQSATLQQPVELQAKHASAVMGERILMMLNQGKQEVTIRLDPAELGSLQIKLHVQQDQVQMVIQTQVGQSRDIIEQNLPRLREQLAQEGINLGEASVEQQSKQDQSSSQESDRLSGSGRGRDRGDSALEEIQSEWLTTQIPLSAQGIDYYA